jgi:hypothetical protein
MDATRPGVDPETMARVLRAEVHRRHGLTLTHDQCLEIVARQLGATTPYPWGGAAATVPVLRIFSVPAATQFYVDFLRFTLDFGGPAGGPGTWFYGQVTRQSTTLHLAEQAYDPRPGATILIWMSGLEALRDELDVRRETVPVWGPAVWVPELEIAPWGARTLTIPDPFGNTLRFNEPDDPAERAGLPVWARG